MPLPFAGPDRLLAHYARTGDARSLGRLFDRTAPELLRVALWLVGDRHDAEDLLQRTFVAVMQSRERYDPARRAVPWMCGVLGNLARRLHEQRARTARDVPIEGVAECAGAGDPVRAARDAELAAAVARMRDALGPPYAEVLDLHLGEGLLANEIATRLGRPAGTVRTQLVRGLGLLKRHLPNGFVAGLLLAGSARAAVLVAAQAAVRQQVVSAALAAQPAGAAAGTAALAIQIAGMTMGKKMLWLAPALLLALGGGVLWWQQDSAAAPVAPAPLAAEVEVVGRDGSSREPVASAAERVAAVAGDALPEPDPDWATLVVRLKWEDDGSPAVGVGIRAQPDPGLPTRMRCGLTGDAGAVTLRRLRPGRVVVDSHFSVPKWIDVEAGRVQTLDLTAPRGETVEGIVLDAAERPVAGARIWLSDSGSVWRGFEVATTGADGRFAMTARGGHVGARCAGYVPSRLRMLTPGHGALTIRLTEAAGAVHGRVVDTKGQPVAEALVAIGWLGGNVIPGSTRDEYYTAPTRPRIVTDVDGRFSCDGVAPGSTEVQAWAAGFGPASTTTLVAVDASAEVMLVLEPGAVVEGVVRDAGGGAVANARVGRAVSYYTFAAVGASTDAEGRFRLVDLPAGEVPLKVWRDGRDVTAQTVATIAGAVTTWNPVLDEGAVLRGRVLAPDGSPVADLTVGVVPDNQGPLDPETTTDADGAFVLDDIRSVPLTLRIEGSCPLAERRFDTAPAAAQVLQLTDREWPSASVSGRVLGVDGATVAATVSVHQAWWRTGPQRVTDERGGFVFERLTPGDYRVAVHAPGYGELLLPQLHLQPGEQVRLPDVQLRPAGRIEFEFRPCEENASFGMLQLLRDDGVTVGHVMPDGAVASAELPAGDYRAIAWGNHSVAVVGFHVDSGTTNRAELVFAPAHRVEFVVTWPGREAPQRLQLIVRDGGGGIVGTRYLEPSRTGNGGSLDCQVAFAVGAYNIEARIGDELVAEVAFTVAAGDPGPMPRIDVPLRQQ
ncbi:MAG: sigma-70 family RNA polymerase sigma factor [Planctomycetes bacterium]|nr:sigma-70 family RNA polymerase sigma factor [Planctomycetota bacterium]